jgi:hypothetical protein
MLSEVIESAEVKMEVVSIIDVLSGFCCAKRPVPINREALKKATMNNK